MKYITAVVAVTAMLWAAEEPKQAPTVAELQAQIAKLQFDLKLANIQAAVCWEQYNSAVNLLVVERAKK